MNVRYAAGALESHCISSCRTWCLLRQVAGTCIDARSAGADTWTRGRPSPRLGATTTTTTRTPRRTAAQLGVLVRGCLRASGIAWETATATGGSERILLPLLGWAFLRQPQALVCEGVWPTPSETFALALVPEFLTSDSVTGHFFELRSRPAGRRGVSMSTRS